MTIMEALNAADELQPNTIPLSQKHQWLKQLQLRIIKEIFTPEEGRPLPAMESLKDPLLLMCPWDSMYLHWLQMQICYHQGELQRYNQANAMFQTLWNDYRNHYNRTHLREKRNIQYG